MEPRRFHRSDALVSIQKITDYRSDFPGSLNEMNETFAQIVQYIQSCPAYHDPDTRIIINESGIFFGHNLKEIEASFPLLKKMLMTRTGKSFSEENLEQYSIQHKGIFVNANWNNSNFDINPRVRLEDWQKRIQMEASTYFNSEFVAAKNNKIIPAALNSPDEAIQALLAKNQFLTIGESKHSDRSGKKILIDNMQALAQQGVKAIFLEHVFADTQSQLLNAYLRSESLEMPAMLKAYLEKLDRGFTHEQFQPYSFTGLVMQAKKYGIQIIPIDSSATYMTGSSLGIGGDSASVERALMMNHLAAKQIERYHNANPYDKCVVFCGSVHINGNLTKVPGITEITGSPTLVVEDLASHNNFKERTEVNPDHIAKPDVLICMNPVMSKAANDLMQEYNTIYQPHLELMRKFASVSDFYASLKDNHSHKKDFIKLLEIMALHVDGMSRENNVTSDMILKGLADLIGKAYQAEQEKFCKGLFSRKTPRQFSDHLNAKQNENHYARLLGLVLVNLYESGKYPPNKSIQQSFSNLSANYSKEITEIFAKREAMPSEHPAQK